MKTIKASDFKAHCLGYLAEAADKNEILIITRYGKPLAQISPIHSVAEKGDNPLKNSILFESDLISPVDESWKADQ